MIPNVAEIEVLKKVLNQSITIRLYGNNVTPSETDTAASFTEIVGGGYALKTLVFVDWTLVSGSPSRASAAIQNFTFTGAINAPGTVYGYYMLDANGILMGAERFPVVPLVAVSGSIIRITPRYSAE